MYLNHEESFPGVYNARHATLQTSRLFGFNLVRSTRAEMADLLVRAAVTRNRLQVNFLNAHCVNLAARDEAYRAILRSSDLLLPDGSGMAMAARMAREPMGRT
jgi:UDP-N-acetyl-D-mannosaminuronic acid transferase (WecB/TagA/CpsF family)